MGRFSELYNNKRWRGMRMKQLRKQPLCERCLGHSIIKPATIAHHKQPHRGNLTLFYDANNLASSCADCHNIDEQRIERGGKARRSVDASGWPE